MTILQSSIQEGVSEEDIASGVLDLSENSDLVEELLSDPFKNIIGQVRTKDILKDTFEGIISGVNIRKDDYEKPIKSMIFAGPSGVGKTLFARQLQSILNEYYQNKLKMIKINCADYSGDNAYALNRLNGASAGFIGSNKKPILHPDNLEGQGRVVLLDEIEKAGPPFWNLLLAILDDGVLDIDYTDSGAINGMRQPTAIGGNSEAESDVSSVKAYFKNTVFIMTSNLGNKELEEAITPKTIGFGSDAPKNKNEIDTKEIVMKAFEQKFLIEMQGRIDDVIPFEHLSEYDAREIISLVINQLITNTLSQKKGFMLEFSDLAKEKILQDIVSTPDFRKFGGRAIEKYFEKYIIPSISRAVNSGQLSQDIENPSCLLVTEKEGQIIFSKIPVRNVNQTSEKVGVIITDI